MKLRDLPRWLAGDVIAFVGVWVSLVTCQRAFTAASERLQREDRRRFKPEEFALLARLLALAESWLGYAIARRAFRLAGLNPRRVRRIEPTLPTGNTAFLRRSGDYLRGVCSMNERAEAMAGRDRKSVV